MKKNAPIGKVLVCGAAAAALLTPASNALAYTLVDGSSSAEFDPTSASGMTSWIVGGANHLTSQSFWTRTQLDTQEYPLSAYNISSSQVDANTVTANYSASTGAYAYSAKVTYDLFSLGASQAQIQESIYLKNLGAEPITLSFYQYNNFDLGANGGGDYGRILTNSSGMFSVAQSVEPGVSSILEDAEVQVNPASVNAQVAYFDTILSTLTDGDVDPLSNYVGPLGPGNIEFAFQWNFTLAPGEDTTISKLKTLDVTLIPEPTTASLAMAALGLLAVRKFRNRR